MISTYSGYDPGGRVLWSWTVRPDILTPGRDRWVFDLARGDTYVSWWGYSKPRPLHYQTPLGRGYHLPGVLEALILAGQVGSQASEPRVQDWVDVAP